MGKARRPTAIIEKGLEEKVPGHEPWTSRVTGELQLDKGKQMEKGSIVVARLKASEGLFILLVVDAPAGRVLTSFSGLTESEVRTLLASNYGLSESDIEGRLVQARTGVQI